MCYLIDVDRSLDISGDVRQKGGTSSMAKVYNEKFKKQLVKEYIQGKSYASLEKEYGVAKSTLSGWVKKYSEECQFSQPHTTNFPVFSPKEIQDLHKRIAELEKENLFLKKAAAFFAREAD